MYTKFYIIAIILDQGHNHMLFKIKTNFLQYLNNNLSTTS